MKEIDCRLKLAEDADWKNSDRIVEMSVAGAKDLRRGTWTMTSDARDPRMKIGVSSGRWAVHSLEATGWTMIFLANDDTKILVELFRVGSQPVEDTGCGVSRGGDGWRQGPPNSDINYVLSFGCI